MRRLIIPFFLILALVHTNLEACTIGVASGKATVDGRPLLWKNRDISCLDNEVAYFTDGRLKYIALTDATKDWHATAGINETGFGIAYANSQDIARKEDKQKQTPKSKPGYKPDLCKVALQICATVNDFEVLLKRTNEEGRSTQGKNFAVIDTLGGAAIFEVGQNSYTKFDANDPKTAPAGFVVRASFGLTGRGFSKIRPEYRYLQTERLWKSAIERKELDYHYLLRTVARNLADENGKPYPIPVEGSIGVLMEKQKNLCPFKEPPPGTINLATGNTLVGAITAASAVIHGVKPNENPLLTTFWILLGHPLFSVAVPCWVAAGSTAPELDGGGQERSSLCDAVLDIRWANTWEYDPKKTDWENAFLKTDKLKDIWAGTYSAEDRIFEQTDAALAKWRKDYPRAKEARDFHNAMALQAMQTLSELKKTMKIAPAPRLNNTTSGKIWIIDKPEDNTPEKRIRKQPPVPDGKRQEHP